MQIEQALYHFLLGALYSPICKGTVLNVGLGPGNSARLLLLSRRVERVVSVEIDQGVIDAYREKYPADDPLEVRHTIVCGNAATVPASAVNPPIDWVYVDTVAAWEDSIFQDLRGLMDWLHAPGVLTKDGGVTIEIGTQHPMVRDFTEWLESRGWRKDVVREALAETGRGRAGAMLVWRLQEAHTP